MNMEELTATKSKVDKELLEIYARRQDFEIRQQEAEEALQRRNDSLNADQKELSANFQELVRVKSLFHAYFHSFITLRRCPVMK